MAEIISDLRDDLVEAFKALDRSARLEIPTYDDLADCALQAIKRWCAKEPPNDKQPWP